MKNVLLCLLSVVLLGSCKKAIEKKQEEAVIEAITNGFWTVTKYIKGTTDLTTDFATYKFQFKENNTVDAYKGNTLDRSGAWQADVGNKTIQSNFMNATTPLSLLNGTWTITNSTWTSVDASKTTNGETSILRLDKQ